MADEPAGTVLLKELSLTNDGDKVVVGDPQTGRFIAVPAVGALVVRALARGATVAEAQAKAEDFAGEPVDVAGFVTALRRVGFVADVVPEASEHRTAPVHLTGWWVGPRRNLVRPLFGRVAWISYAVAAGFAVVAMAAEPDVRPAPPDAFVTGNAGLSLAVLLLLATASTALHECWHWLAAAAAGVPARFGIDRRWFFVVMETDLSQIWRLPRRERYGPVLAGLAVDGVLLAVLVGVQLGAVAGQWSLPAAVGDVLRALLFVKLAAIAWQMMVFLRTDLYGVLQIATGCRNLWRVKTLLLRQAFGRLNEAGRAELTRANPRDISVGRWFRWVWLGGFGLGAAWFAVFYLPVMWILLQWVVGHGESSIWYRLVVLALVAWAHVLLAYAGVRNLLRRLARPTRPAQDQA